MKFLFILVSLITFASIGRSTATIFSRFNYKFTKEQLKYLRNKNFNGKGQIALDKNDLECQEHKFTD
jgi:hypothetical protein